MLAERLTPANARHAGRALRAQRVHPGDDLGHRLVRPVGRGARQGAGAADHARARKRRRAALGHDSSTNTLIRRYRRLRDGTRSSDPAHPDQPARRQAGAAVRCWSTSRKLVTAYYSRGARSRGAGAARRLRHLRPSRLARSTQLQRGARAGDHPGDLRLPQAARHRRPAVPRHGHPRAVAAGASPARSKCSQPTASTSWSATGGEYTPTPAISHAILTYNRGRTSGLADGIVITPSHNPPDDGGFKYNPPNGGPADDRRHRLDREARPTRLLEAGLTASGASPLRAGAARGDDAPPRLSRRLRRRPRQRHRHRGDPRRRHPHRRRSARRRGRALLGARSPSATGST